MEDDAKKLLIDKYADSLILKCEQHEGLIKDKETRKKLRAIKALVYSCKFSNLNF